MGAVGDIPALLSEEDVDLLSASLIFVEIHGFEPSGGMRGGKGIWIVGYSNEIID